jgi:hypothetical protein
MALLRYNLYIIKFIHVYMTMKSSILTEEYSYHYGLILGEQLFSPVVSLC